MTRWTDESSDACVHGRMLSIYASVLFSTWQHRTMRSKFYYHEYRYKRPVMTSGFALLVCSNIIYRFCVKKQINMQCSRVQFQTTGALSAKYFTTENTSTVGGTKCRTTTLYSPRQSQSSGRWAWPSLWDDRVVDQTAEPVHPLLSFGLIRRKPTTTNESVKRNSLGAASVTLEHKITALYPAARAGGGDGRGTRRLQ